jgi:hypothetical protein
MRAYWSQNWWLPVLVGLACLAHSAVELMLL